MDLYHLCLGIFFSLHVAKKNMVYGIYVYNHIVGNYNKVIALLRTPYFLKGKFYHSVWSMHRMSINKKKHKLGEPHT